MQRGCVVANSFTSKVSLVNLNTYLSRFSTDHQQQSAGHQIMTYVSQEDRLKLSDTILTLKYVQLLYCHISKHLNL
jgi:hypothetical protein